jgi:hypothetical protein
LFYFNQSALFQDFDVEGDGLAGNVKISGDGIQVLWFSGQQADDGPAGRIGDGLENVSSGFHNTQAFACKNNGQVNACQIFL